MSFSPDYYHVGGAVGAAVVHAVRRPIINRLINSYQNSDTKVDSLASYSEEKLREIANNGWVFMVALLGLGGMIAGARFDIPELTNAAIAPTVTHGIELMVIASRLWKNSASSHQ